MTCSKNFGRLLQASCLGLIGALTVVGCGGSETKAPNKDSGVPDGGGGAPGAANVAVSSPTLNLGTVDVGKTSSTPSIVTVTNKGAATSLNPSVTTGPFSIVATTCDTLAAAPATCTISVSFSPTAVGAASGTLTVAGTVKVSLSGTGAPLASFSVTDKIDLGVVSAGAIVPGRVNVTATTALTDLICSVSSGGNIVADATVVGTCTATLAAGASCVVGFNFSSLTAGVKSGDQVVCNAGSVTKTTAISATVVTAAKLVISPPTGSTAATIGKTADVVFNIANGGGVNSGTLTAAITPANPEFAVGPSTCTPGVAPLATCTVTVTFKPTSAGTKNATLVVTDSLSPTTPLSAAITGVASAPSNLTISGTADFGSVAVGTAGTAVVFTVKNTGGVAAPGVAVASSDGQFIIGSDTCTGQTLAATTGSCTLTVTFSPAATATLGVISALITASSTGGNPISLPVIGTAIKPPTLSITPNPLAFDGISLNVQSGDKTLTVTNTGAASTGALTVPAGLGAGFVISGNTCSAALAPTETCTISIRFTPNAIAQATFTLTVSSASGAIGTAVLTGTGKQPNVLDITPVNVMSCSDKDYVPASGDSPAIPCFVDTAVGQTDGSFPKTPTDAPITFTISNANVASAGGINLESGPVTVTIGGTNASDFLKVSTNCGPTLQPSQSCTVKVSFKPSAAGVRTATISATSTNGGNVGANLAGYGLPPVEMNACGRHLAGGAPGVSLTNGTAKSACAELLKTNSDNSDDHTGLDFGQVSLGADCNPANVKWFLVTINSSTAADYMNLITATLTDPQTPNNFRIANTGNTDACNNINWDVSKGAKQCWISVQFMPQGTAKEAKTATVTAAGGSGGTASLALAGISTGPLTINPAKADFGTVVVNEAGELATNVTLTVNNWSRTAALGPVTATVSGATGDFRLVYDTCTGNTIPVQSDTTCGTSGACFLGYRFFPSTTGARDATVTVTAGTQTSTATLHGVGVPETTITASPLAVPFGPIMLSKKSDWQTITVTAGAGSQQTGTLKFEIPSGDLKHFEIGAGTDAGTCGVSDSIRLGGGNQTSCTIKVRFIATVDDALGAQHTTLTVSDPRDFTLTQKIALTGTGTTALSISPTTADFGLIAATETVSTILTFTVTNNGSVAIATPVVTFGDAMFAESPGPSGNCNGASSIAIGGTCLIQVAMGAHNTAGVFSASPGITITGPTSGADKNQSKALAVLSATVQTDALLELVGQPAVSGDDTGFAPTFDLGNALSGATGGTATLLFRNTGGHDTGKISYYFYNAATAGTDPSGTSDGIDHNDADFQVIPPTSETDTDNCLSAALKLKGGHYCKVQVVFKPTHTGVKTVGFKLVASPGGTPQTVAFMGRGLDPNVDKLTIAPAFYDFTATPATNGMLTTTAEFTNQTPMTFTVHNGFTATTTLSITVPPPFVRVTPAGSAAPCGTTLTQGGNCFVYVGFLPQSATVTYQMASLSVNDSTSTNTYTAGMMGKVREGTVLAIWDPATGVDFGKVPQNTASAPMAFTVMNIGDAPTTAAGVSMAITGTAASAVKALFTPSGCGAGALAALSLSTPGSAATCAAQVVLNPGNTAAGAVVPGGVTVKLEADAVGTNPANAANQDLAFSSANTMAATSINPAQLSVLPTATYTFPAVEAIGQTTSNTVKFVTIMNGNATLFQSTSPITFSLLEGSVAATNFVLDLDPSSAPMQTCEAAKDPVTGSLVLKGNDQCVVGVTFEPQAMPTTGTSFTANFTATATTGGTTLALPFKGTGKDMLELTSYGATGTENAVSDTTRPTTTLDFGSAQSGKVSGSIVITITNQGASDTGLLSTSLTGDFFVTNDTCQGDSLAAGDTCTVTLKFAPTTAVAKTGSLVVTGKPGGTSTVALKGTGT